MTLPTQAAEGPLFAVCYDVSNDRERYRVDKLLKGYGFRVQKSVFECRLNTAARQLFAAGLAVLGFALSHAQSGLVTFYGPLSRIVTPNGDGLNDLIFFCFENPQDSDISGKIYTVLGTEVSSIGPRLNRAVGAGEGCPASIIRAQYSTWNGMAGNERISSGVYVYRIKSEDQVFSGTVIVVR